MVEIPFLSDMTELVYTTAFETQQTTMIRLDRIVNENTIKLLQWHVILLNIIFPPKI